MVRCCFLVEGLASCNCCVICFNVWFRLVCMFDDVYFIGSLVGLF